MLCLQLQWAELEPVLTVGDSVCFELMAHRDPRSCEADVSLEVAVADDCDMS
jgi:hypothetical protein